MRVNLTRNFTKRYGKNARDSIFGLVYTVGDINICWKFPVIKFRQCDSLDMIMNDSVNTGLPDYKEDNKKFIDFIYFKIHSLILQLY